MTPIDFHWVDVFAIKPYSGNQLAVILNAGKLDTPTMQMIAQEINFSETTFVLSDTPEQSGYPVRIFTPAQEIPFAGHPTLGTAYVIQQQWLKTPVQQITLNLPIGPIPVSWELTTTSGEWLWMQQNPPVFTQQLSREAIAPILNLQPEDIDDRYPIQTVSTGIPFIIVPLKTHSALKQCRIQTHQYYAAIPTWESQAIFVFCPQTNQPENHFSARMFAPTFAVPEDPATGSANGCFAAYLVRYSYLGQPSIDVRVEQGYEINRPSLLRLRAQQNPEYISVQVGGQVIPIAQGQMFLP